MTDPSIDTAAASSRIAIAGDERPAGAHAAPASGRRFRDAWAWPAEAGGAIEIDMASARAIHRERLRAARAERWAAADAAWFRAMEAGDDAGRARAEALKRRLRAAPTDPRIDAAPDPEALDALTLEVLTTP